MGARHIARDGQAQARATRLQVAPLIQAVKRAEGFLAPCLGNAGAIVFHADLHQSAPLFEADGDLAAMLEGIVDQVDQAAAQPRPLDADMDIVRHAQCDAALTRFGARLGSVAHQRPQIGDFGVLAAFAAGEGQIFVQHMLHLGDVALHGFHVGIRRHHRQRQLQPGQRCLDVMADARQHFGALGNMALDALAHGDEGLGGAAHFGGAIGLEVGDGAALAEAFGGAGQPLDGPHLVAQEQNGDAHQQE